MNSMRFCFFSVRFFNRFLYFYGYIITYPIAFCNLCRPKIKRTLSKRRNFRAFCQILAWSTYSSFLHFFIYTLIILWISWKLRSTTIFCLCPKGTSLTVTIYQIYLLSFEVRFGFITYLHYFRILYISPIKQPASYLFATMHSQCFLASAKLLISQNPTFPSIVRSCISL